MGRETGQPDIRETNAGSLTIWLFGAKKIFLTKMPTQMGVGGQRERERWEIQEDGQDIELTRFLLDRPRLGSCGWRGAVWHQEGSGRIKAGMGSVPYAILLGVG